MGSKTKIEWTDASWNPISGCSKVSAGCKNCYAEAMARRFNKEWKPWTAANAAHNVRMNLHPVLEIPLRWRKPRKVIVCSMGDLFHDEVRDEFIARVFAVMVKARKHIFQVLTKRPGRMEALLNSRKFNDSVSGQIAHWLSPRKVEHWYHDPHLFTWPLPNVWLGVTAENQANADERIPLLLKTPAAVRFVSIEPLIEPVDLGDFPPFCWPNIDPGTTAQIREMWGPKLPENSVNAQIPEIRWVIVGGESGPKARPMHPAWVRSIRDQCQAAGVPFHFKQHGEWVGQDDFPQSIAFWEGPEHSFGDGAVVYRVGKTAAGRELDGRTYDQYPEKEFFKNGYL